MHSDGWEGDLEGEGSDGADVGDGGGGLMCDDASFDAFDPAKLHRCRQFCGRVLRRLTQGCDAIPEARARIACRGGALLTYGSCMAACEVLWGRL